MESTTARQLDPLVEAITKNCELSDHVLNSSREDQLIAVLRHERYRPTPTQRKLIRGNIAIERCNPNDAQSAGNDPIFEELAAEFRTSVPTVLRDIEFALFVDSLPDSARLCFYRGEVNGVEPQARSMYRLLVERPEGLTSIEASELYTNTKNASRLLYSLLGGGHVARLPEKRGEAHVYLHRLYCEQLPPFDAAMHDKKKAEKKRKGPQKDEFPIPATQGEAFKRLYEIADELGPILKSPNRYHFNYTRFKRLGEEVFHIINCFREEGVEN